MTAQMTKGAVGTPNQWPVNKTETISIVTTNTQNALPIRTVLTENGIC